MSFPRYERYKDSSIEWIGDLPNDWKTDKIKFNTYVKGRVGWHGLNSNEFSDEGVHLVTGTDFDNGFVNWDRCYRISEERYSEDPYIQLKENDLLITKDGTIGKLARVKGLPEQASLNSGIFLVRAKNKAYLEDYLYWVLQSSLFVHFMDLHKTGSTIQHLYQEVFNQFAFPIPSQSEQHQICIFLDRETAKIDELIAEQQRLIELLKEKRQAVISHAVTKGLNPNAPMKDSGIEWLGEVPAHWEMKRLKNISPFITVGIVVNPSEYVSDDGLPFIYGGDISEGVIDFNNSRRITAADSYRNEKTRLISGDLLTVRVGAPGITAVVPEECNGGNCASVMLIRQGCFDSHWLCYAMNSRMVRFQVEIVQYGAAQEQFNISHAINFWIATPDKKEQSAIVAFLDRETAKLDALSAEAQRGIELLKERRTALISAAVTGKIDVRDLVTVQSQIEAAA